MKKLLLIIIIVISVSSLFSLTTIDTVWQLADNLTIDDDILITETGGITNDINHNPTLTVTGSITNQGYIGDWNSRTLTVNAQGDISNSGQWYNRYTNLTGSSDQYVSCSLDGSFSGPFFTNSNPTNIIADGDLYFSSCDVNFQNTGILNLSAGYDLYLDDTKLQNAIITGGNTSYIDMVNGGYLYNLSMSDMNLSGSVIHYGTFYYSGSLINSGTIVNYIGGSAVLNISCDFVNNGDIYNFNGRTLTLNLEGDITNNGTWTHHYTNLTGTTEQTIICATDCSFAGISFENANTTSIIAGSDLTFSGCEVDFQDIAPLDLSGGFELISSNCVLNGLDIIGGYGAIFNMINGGYAYNIDASDIILAGEIILWGNDCNFSGSLVNNGIIKNFISGSAVLNIACDFVNNGDIYNYNGRTITLNLEGDITNNGSWTHQYTNLTGIADQTISSEPDSSFAGLYFDSVNPASIIAESDLSFLGCEIDFNDTGSLDLSGGFDLNIDDCILDGLSITGGNGSIINMVNGRYANNLTASNVILEGDMILWGNDFAFSGSLINNGTIRNYISGSAILNIGCDFVNNGDIYNWNGRTITLNLEGNVTNNGTWTHQYTNFTGSTDQTLFCGTGNSFAGIYCSNTNTGSLIADSDITFLNCNVDFNDIGTLDLSEGYDLLVSGGYLSELNISGGIGTEVVLSEEAYLQSNTFENVILSGYSIMYGTNDFSGFLINNGTITNSLSSNGILNIACDLINNDTITEWNGRTITLHIEGNIENNGVWANRDTFLDGTLEQHISCGENAVFGGYYFKNNNLNNIVADSDLNFNTRLDFLNNGSFDFSGGYTLYTSGAFYYKNVDIIGGNGAGIYCEGESYFENVSIHDMILDGTIINSGTNYYTGNTVSNGVFQNHSSSYPSVYMEDFTNNGDVINVNTRYINLFISGDVLNFGTWNNYYNKFNGIEDQAIILENSTSIAGNTIFISDITGVAYQWYFDSEILDSPDFSGETSQNLAWNQNVSAAYEGTYYCVADGEYSRNITITPSQIIITPNQLHFSIDNSIAAQDSQNVTITNTGGSPISITLSSSVTVTDIDGNEYSTVQIGNQLWMAENLKVTHYRNGEPIPNEIDNNTWANLTTGAYCYFDNDPANGNVYGALYNWYAVDDSRNIAPQGWHVPDDEEIKQLQIALGMSPEDADGTGWFGANEGSKLAGDTDLWIDGSLEDDPEFDTSCFRLLPGTSRNFSSGEYGNIGELGYFWSSTEYSSLLSWFRSLSYDRTQIRRYRGYKQWGYSVRCIRDDNNFAIRHSNGNLRTEWLSYNPDALTIQPGESVNVTVFVDASTLEPGDYYDIITFSSNDQAIGTIDLPVTMNVTGVLLDADFEADLTVIEHGDPIQFTDTSQGSPTSWEWDFDNDGTIDSNEQNPSWAYASGGTYTVSLTISDGTTSDTETKENYITVLDSAYPDWEINPSDYEYTGTIWSVIILNGIEVDTTSGLLGCFVGEECRGIAQQSDNSTQYIEYFDRTFYMPMIYSNFSSGETITFKYYDPISEEIYQVSESVDFVADMVIGGGFDPFEMHASDAGTIIKEMVPGWNWFSINVSADDMSTNTVLASLGDNASNIKSQTQNATYYPGPGWLGSLTTIDNLNFYKISVDNTTELVFSGNPVILEENVYELSSGWNWISFAPQLPESINYALADIVSGYSIKSQTQNSAYYPGPGWLGSLTTLEPLGGYMLQMNEAETFTYPYPATALGNHSYTNSGITEKKSQTRQSDEWSINPHAFEFNGSFWAVVEFNESFTDDVNDCLAAFCGDECRGVASKASNSVQDYSEIFGNTYFLPMIYSNAQEGDEISFKFYDASEETVYEIAESIQFEKDMIIGNGYQPLVLHANLTGDDDSNLPLAVGFNCYPNPFNPETTIEYSVKETGRVKIEVYNIKGQKTATLLDEIKDTGIYQLVWNADKLNSGVYFIRYSAGEYEGVSKALLLK